MTAALALLVLAGLIALVIRASSSRPRPTSTGGHQPLDSHRSPLPPLQRDDSPLPPAITDAGNLIYHKDFDAAIRTLQATPDSTLRRRDAGMKHLELAIAHFKKREIDASNRHYYLAIRYGHDTGYAHEHLAINLTKQGKLEEALRVCDIALSDPKVPSEHSYLSKADFERRRGRIVRQLARRESVAKTSHKKRATQPRAAPDGPRCRATPSGNDFNLRGPRVSASVRVTGEADWRVSASSRTT